MDYYIEHLKLVIEQNGGIISAAELQKEGINRANIYEGLINGIIQKESHGNYVLVEEQPDEFRIIQNRSEKLIFSHLLYFSKFYTFPQLLFVKYRHFSFTMCLFSTKL